MKPVSEQETNFEASTITLSLPSTLFLHPASQSALQNALRRVETGRKRSLQLVSRSRPCHRTQSADQRITSLRHIVQEGSGLSVTRCGHQTSYSSARPWPTRAIHAFRQVRPEVLQVVLGNRVCPFSRRQRALHWPAGLGRAHTYGIDCISGSSVGSCCPNRPRGSALDD